MLLEVIEAGNHYAEAILTEEHAGIRSGHTTVEQVFALRQLFQHRLERQNGKVFCAFIDYKKAFMIECVMKPYLQS